MSRWRAWGHNFADRAYLAFFLAITFLIVCRADRVAGWQPWVVVNACCLLGILLLVRLADRRPVWRFLHDWYPLAVPIVTFEEISRLSFLFRSGWQDHYILHLEAKLFSVPPTVWLGQHGSPLMTEVVEIGYFSYFLLLMIVAGGFYARSDRTLFRRVMDASVLSYLLCYAVFLSFPTEGPAHTLATQHRFALPGGGPFHWAVRLIQRNAGVHGNAFPSAHVAGGTVAVIFAWRYSRWLGTVLTILLVLLCVGAVYDRYHYLSDVIAGIPFGVTPALIFWRTRPPLPD
jgi:membrane-associated phospholipid phosphatase